MSGMNENNRWNVASEMQSRKDITTGEASTQSQRWISLLGEPSRESRPSRYGRVARVNNQLPDEYVGENLFLARELEGLTNNMGNVFTTEIYPMVTSDHVGRIEMTTWEFNRGIMHQEPWEGVPHLFTTKRKTRFVTVHRKGGGLKFEGDDLMTAKGREEYELKFMGVASVMIETYSMDTLVAIFRAIRTYRRENSEHRANRLTVKRRILEERRRFATMNRNPEAFNKIITEVRQMLIKRGVAGPFYVLAPPGTINSLRLDSFPDAKQRLDRQYAADGGEGALDRTSDIQRLNLGNGITIVEVPEILVETPGIPTQPLSRNVITGSFYMIALPKHLFNVNMFGTPYFSLSRAIRVWNTDGGYSVITLRDALEHAQFPNMESVSTVLADGPKAGGRQGRGSWEKKDFDPSLDGTSDRGRHKHVRAARRAHMMIFWDKDHSALPVRLFGQMDQNVLPFSVIRRMAECVAKNTGISEAQYMKVHKLLIRLARAPGDNQWFKKLADMNVDYSVSAGEFVGERTHDGAADIVDYRSVPNLREWTPQPYGGLLLPDPTVIGAVGGVGGVNMAVPPGQCSYPGIRAIGTLSTNSGYADGLVEDCIEADDILGKIESGLTGGLASLVADAKQRSEWFHDANARTTIVQTLFSGPKDALFLGVPRDSTLADPDQTLTIPTGQHGKQIRPVATTLATDAGKYSDEATLLWRKMGTQSANAYNVLYGLSNVAPFTSKLWDEFALSLASDAVDKDTVRRMIMGLNAEIHEGTSNDAERRTKATKIIVVLLGGKSRRSNSKTARDKVRSLVTSGKEILDKLAARTPPVLDEDQTFTLDAGVGTGVTTNAKGTTRETVAAYYRAPLTMSVGLVPFFRASTGTSKRFWALPSDPRFGHTRPLTGTKGFEKAGPAGGPPLIPTEFAKRPSYRDPQTHVIGESIWHTTHLETSLNSSQDDEAMEDGEGQYQKAFGDIYASMGGVEGGEEDEYSDEEGFGHKTDEVIGAMMGAADIGGRYSKDAEAAWSLTEADRAKDLGKGGGYILPFGGTIPISKDYIPPITDDEAPDTYGRIAAQLSVTNIAYNLRMTTRIASPFIRAMAIAIILSRCDKPAHWIALEDSSILTPCAAIIQRPALEQVLASMVMLKPGPETGVNIFGNLSTWVGGHTATKTVLVHITHTAATFTKQPKNIAAIANVRAQGVVSGGGDRWITSVDELSTENPDNRGDLLPVIVPITEGQMPEHLSVLGYMNKVATDVGAERSASEVNPQFSSIQYLMNRLKSDGDEYYSLEELYNPNEGEDEHDDLVADMSSLPMILLRDEWVESDGTLVASRSHRSTSTQGNGAEEVWNGMDTYFKTIYDKPTNALVHAY